jgi:hypothetical protein
MTVAPGTSGSAPTATFHARVASVGLITALVVLVAACTTFMLQRWAVARTQSHQMHQTLAEVAAGTAAGPLQLGDRTQATAVVTALAGTKTIVGVRLEDPQGRAIASFERPPTTERPETEVIPSES